MSKNTHDDPRLISFSYLRKAVGFLGFFLPIILVLGSVFLGNCQEIQDSISDYYYTSMRNILVGILCAIALFLFSYKGYPNDKRDNIAGTAAAFFALGIAFFPTKYNGTLIACDALAPTCNIPPLTPNPAFVNTFHFIFATLFFLVLTYFSLVLFTQGNSNTEEKRKRNKVYKTCGYIMLVCIGLIALYTFFLENKYPDLTKINPIFWLETIALWAFATSWLIKGELFLKDK